MWTVPWSLATHSKVESALKLMLQQWEECTLRSSTWECSGQRSNIWRSHKHTHAHTDTQKACTHIPPHHPQRKCMHSHVYTPFPMVHIHMHNTSTCTDTHAPTQAQIHFSPSFSFHTLTYTCPPPTPPPPNTHTRLQNTDRNRHMLRCTLFDIQIHND